MPSGGHGCLKRSLEAAACKQDDLDTWLGGVVGEITQTSDYQQGRTLILVAFDESSSSTTTRVPAIAVAGGIQPIADGTLYDHYALLRRRDGRRHARRNALLIPCGRRR